MFTIGEVLSHENQETALAHFAAKRAITGPDGMNTHELSQYWIANGDRICEEIQQCAYQLGVVRIFERLSNSGKKRGIASISAVDRMVERMFQQVMQRYYEPTFCECSFAYREGKGPLAAVMQAREHIEQGNKWLCEIDIKDFFDEIPHDIMLSKLRADISDEAVLDMLRKTMGRYIENRSRITRKTKGIIQGSSLSPLLSDIFMNRFDMQMQLSDMPYIRFGDNLFIFTKTNTEAAAAFNMAKQTIENHLGLHVNERKSGVFKAANRRMLGYDFRLLKDGAIDLRKHVYQPKSKNANWHQSVAFETDREIHIVQDGVLNKQDYSLLFENKDEKHHIPVEVVEQLNIYGDVCVSPAALRTLDRHSIRLSYFDKFGNLTGVYTPAKHGQTAQTFLKQCQLYNNADKRLELARAMEDAGVCTMRKIIHSFLGKVDDKELREVYSQLAECREHVLDAKSVNELMLHEAHARRIYYSAFDCLVQGTGFVFESRTRRPPKNELNALISFGNTVLYNKFLQLIWKTSLDPKIGVVHATNRRPFSLNLDFADLFKPVVVDRTILSLIRRREIKTDLHFHREADGAVLLNDRGKRLFLSALNRKLNVTSKRRGSEKSYARLLSDEVDGFRRLILHGEQYKPYKHY